MPVHLVPAESRDAAGLFALRLAAEDWLEQRRIRQWGRGEVSLADIQGQVERGEWHVARTATGLDAGLRLLWSDADIWQQDDGFAAYVHGIVIDRQQAGRGLGAAMLDWAAQQGRAAAAPALRLDCVETNSGLQRYYEGLGFVVVGRRDFPAPWLSAVLLERTLLRDEATPAVPVIGHEGPCAVPAL